jgi:hypothetical protein
MDERQQRLEVEPGVYRLLAECTAADLAANLEMAPG